MLTFPSTLIISSHPKIDVKNFPFANNPDLFIIGNDDDHGIDNIRQIQSFLSKKPIKHPFKVVIIHRADNLSLESQNSLLKILEEPGPDNFIILTAPHLHNFIPTILSRCHLVRQNITHSSAVDKLSVSSNIQTNLAASEKIISQFNKDRTKIIEFIDQQISLHQQLLVSHPDLTTVKTINRLITTSRLLLANVDPLSALDYFFLT